MKKLWIARDKDGDLYLYINKPELTEPFYDDWDSIKGCFAQLNKNEFPEVTFENSPQQIEIKLIEK